MSEESVVVGFEERITVSSGDSARLIARVAYTRKHPSKDGYYCTNSEIVPAWHGGSTVVLTYERYSAESDPSLKDVALGREIGYEILMALGLGDLKAKELTLKFTVEGLAEVKVTHLITRGQADGVKKVITNFLSGGFAELSTKATEEVINEYDIVRAKDD